MENQLNKGEWIRIAGNPSQIRERKPPYWRFARGFSKLNGEQGIDGIRILGTATGMNMHDGMEPGASFLLWVQAYGAYSVQVEGGNRILEIHLQDPIEHRSLEALTPIDEIKGKILIYGAPDLAKAKNSGRWRCVVGDRGLVLRSLSFMGELTHENFRAVADLNAGMHRRLWLEITGTLQLDIEGNATIQV